MRSSVEGSLVTAPLAPTPPPTSLVRPAVRPHPGGLGTSTSATLNQEAHALDPCAAAVDVAAATAPLDEEGFGKAGRHVPPPPPLSAAQPRHSPHCASQTQAAALLLALTLFVKLFWLHWRPHADDAAAAAAAARACRLSARAAPR